MESAGVRQAAQASVFENQNRILAAVASGRTEEAIDRIVEFLRLHLEAKISILGLEPGGAGRILRAPDLPRELTIAIEKHWNREGVVETIAKRRGPRVVDLPAFQLEFSLVSSTAERAGLELAGSIPIFDAQFVPLAVIDVFRAPGAHRAEPQWAVDSAIQLIRLVLTQEQAVEAYRKREASLRTLMASSHESICICDIDGKFLYLNYAILGYEPEELTSVSLMDLVHPEDSALAQAIAVGIRNKPGSSAQVELRIRSREGDWRLTEVHARNCCEDSAIQGLVLRIRDITDRHAAERALAVSEERFRGLFENAVDLIFTHDLAGNITSFNQTAERVTGHSRNDALCMNISRILKSEQQEVLRHAIEQMLGGERAVNYRLDLVTQRGADCPVEVNSRLIFEEGRPAGVQSIARDISERQSLESQLIQAQKMEAIGQLAGGVAHDFNNLLTVITGYTQWILDDLAMDHPLREAASETMLAADRASALTSQLLAFSRNQAHQPEPIDLNIVVTRLDRMLRRIIGEDIQLELLLGPGLGQVCADSAQVEQVILNLVINSRDAMPEGGRITIETKSFNVDERDDAKTGCSPGAWVSLAVSDTGCGMEEKTRQRIFEPFFTTKEKGKGTGLGLSTVYGIVQQNRGRIAVDSEVGNGSSFRVYLPRHIEPGSDSLLAGPEARPVSGNESILLVEDEPDVRRVIREMLKRQGYQVVEAADAESALEFVREHQGKIDLLVTDVVIPGANGRELAAQLRAMRPDLRVLYISGYTDDAILQNRILSPGVLFLQKPFTPDLLARKVREALDGQ
ncbi:MAG: PAS domain S-box protein [Bryobacteraceae bacterium]